MTRLFPLPSFTPGAPPVPQRSSSRLGGGRACLRSCLGLIFCLGALSTLPAFAAPSTACASLPGVIYGTGGSATQPFIGKYAAALAGLASPVTVVYQAPGACVAMAALGNPSANLLKGTATYWNTAGKALTCDLPLAGVAADFGAMGIYANSCPGVTKIPAGVGDFLGVISSWNFIVPNNSTQQSISAEAAYFVLGYGSAGGVEPWTSEAALAIRNATSAATVVISIATGIPANKFKGVDAKTNQGSVNNIIAVSNPETALGYCSGEIADANRSVARTLAYQHFGQSTGYWPDSSATAFDKLGVREGEYFLWTSTHLFAFVDNNGVPTNPNVAKFIGYFAGTLPAPAGVNLLDLTIANGNIPQCAMHVWRDGDLAPLYSYQPSAPCGCYFDFKATGSSSCTACTANNDCPSNHPVCRHGFCEVQ